MNHPQLKNLTLEEKAAILSGGSFWSSASIERAGIEAATLTDGPHGVRKQDGKADHLGINDSLPSTAFPTAAATGSTWDPELLERLGEALGRESRALGVDVLLGPGVNIKRSPLCGRNFEYFSEDPLLTGKLGAAWVRGIQSQGVGASVKHFAVNNQETDRQRISAEVDERTMREIYLRGFEIITEESRPATFMCSYNRINGVSASENRWLLTTVLRDEWGFDGYVMSDWGAVTNRVAALQAGLDLEMPTSAGRGTAAIVEGVGRGVLDETVVDTSAARVLDVHERLRGARGDAAAVDWQAHHELARELAASSAVLLKNDADVLPLLAEDGGPIAVIGEFARSPRYQGAGSSHINPTKLDDALSAIRNRTSRAVVFAPGFAVEQETPVDSDDEALLSEARDAAAGAAVTVLFLGLPSIDESEGYDRTHLQLPERQLRVLEAVLEVTHKVVVVLSNGGVVDVSSFDARVDGILETWLSGQAGGGAVSDILFGDREPGGRLAETIPRRLEDNPTLINWPGARGKVHYGERIYVGYRWYDKTARDVAYPFGHGLGYTTFKYSDLTVAADHTGARVGVTIENTGSRRGSEVLQVYVGDQQASVDRPVRELAGFQKLTLEPGASQRVVVDLPARAWAFWDDGWRAESGRFDIAVGASSRDIRLSAEVDVTIPDDVKVLDENSTLNEWVEHPMGRSLLECELANLHPQARNLTSGETLRLAGSIPLRTLVGMSGASDPGALVNSLLARL